jgi:hypothetical protein
MISARPETWPPSEAWMKHIASRLDELEEARGRDLNKSNERLGALEEKLSKGLDDVKSQVVAVQTRMRDVLGGKNGLGLDMTFVGLSLAGVGSALQL